MRDSRWISEEARLWFQFMDNRNYWVKKPSQKYLDALSSKERRAVLTQYNKDVAQKFAAGWRNFREFTQH